MKKKDCDDFCYVLKSPGIHCLSRLVREQFRHEEGRCSAPRKASSCQLNVYIIIAALKATFKFAGPGLGAPEPGFLHHGGLSD